MGEKHIVTDRGDPVDRDRWARLRFAIIGPLLAAPPLKGELRARGPGSIRSAASRSGSGCQPWSAGT
jgi:hypothetical protein